MNTIDGLYQMLEEVDREIDQLFDDLSERYCPDYCAGEGFCSHCEIEHDIDNAQRRRELIKAQIRALEKVESSHEQ